MPEWQNRVEQVSESEGAELRLRAHHVYCSQCPGALLEALTASEQGFSIVTTS